MRGYFITFFIVGIMFCTASFVLDQLSNSNMILFGIGTLLATSFIGALLEWVSYMISPKQNVNHTFSETEDKDD